MISNLTNNMIISLAIIKQIPDNIEHKNIVDIETIINNAKNDKRFHKLLTLCIKYDICIFNQFNNKCTLLDINNLISQSIEKQKQYVIELSTKILEISLKSHSENLLVDVDNIYIQYRKKFKEMEIIIYVLKNIFNDDILQSLCCVTSTSNSPSNSKQTCTKKDISKYIAVYSN